MLVVASVVAVVDLAAEAVDLAATWADTMPAAAIGMVGIWHNGNYWHAPIYHGAWYAGEENWDSPHCGYYLYPPCRYQ